MEIPSRIQLVMAQFGDKSSQFGPALSQFIDYYRDRGISVHLLIMTELDKISAFELLKKSIGDDRLITFEKGSINIFNVIDSHDNIFEFEKYIEKRTHPRYGWRMNDYWKLFGNWKLEIGNLSILIYIISFFIKIKQTTVNNSQ